MKNQKYSKVSGLSHVLILSIVGVVLVLGALGYLYYINSAKSNSQLQQEAIDDAEQYRSGKTCFSEMTPAVHNATGAEYTFSSSCLAHGWTSLKN